MTILLIQRPADNSAGVFNPKLMRHPAGLNLFAEAKMRGTQTTETPCGIPI